MVKQVEIIKEYESIEEFLLLDIIAGYFTIRKSEYIKNKTENVLKVHSGSQSYRFFKVQNNCLR
jgi:hypothetical protein